MESCLLEKKISKVDVGHWLLSHAILKKYTDRVAISIHYYLGGHFKLLDSIWTA